MTDGVLYNRPGVNCLLKTMAELLEEGKFTDVLIQVEGKVFRAHKAVLYSNSSKLKDLLTAAEENLVFDDQTPVKIKLELDVNYFEKILQYMYSERMLITGSNVLGILTTAEILQMTDLKEFCLRQLPAFIYHQNAVEMHRVGWHFSDDAVKKKASQEIISNMALLVEEINQSSLAELCRLVSDGLDYCDDNPRNVSEKLYEAALLWVKYDLDSRSKRECFEQVADRFDFDKMSGRFLRKVLEDDLVKEGFAADVRERIVMTLAKRVEKLELEKEILDSYQRTKGRVVYTFNGLKELEIGQQVFSETREYVCGMPWDISIKKTEKNDSVWLSVFANCNREDAATEWACKASVVFTLHNTNPEGETMKLPLHPATIFSPKTFSGWGFSEFLNWDEVLARGNKFVTSEGSITVQIDVEANRTAYDEIEEQRPRSQSSIG